MLSYMHVSLQEKWVCVHVCGSGCLRKCEREMASLRTTIDYSLSLIVTITHTLLYASEDIVSNKHFFFSTTCATLLIGVSNLIFDFPQLLPY